jgi:hypothetical protein
MKLKKRPNKAKKQGGNEGREVVVLKYKIRNEKRAF